MSRKKDTNRRPHKKPAPTAGRAIPLPAGADRWHIVRAYVPVADIWSATGIGTAGIVRRSPDGQYWSSFIPIQLNGGGAFAFFGDRSKPLADVEATIAMLTDRMPPMEDGDPDLACRYAYGAYAWTLEEGHSFSGDAVAPFLHLFPPMPGKRAWWLQQFLVSDPPLIPTDLLQALVTFRPPPNLPEHKEVATATIMIYQGLDQDRLLAVLADDERFQEQPPSPAAPPAPHPEVRTFFYIKPRELNPAEIVPHGAVLVSPGTVALHAATLSNAAALAWRLRRRLGPSFRMSARTWTKPQDLVFKAAGLQRLLA